MGQGDSGGQHQAGVIEDSFAPAIRTQCLARVMTGSGHQRRLNDARLGPLILPAARQRPCDHFAFGPIVLQKSENGR